jgi:hypothetical protein
MQTTRRVRHDVADAVRLALFSLGVSSTLATALVVWVHWMDVA